MPRKVLQAIIPNLAIRNINIQTFGSFERCREQAYFLNFPSKFLSEDGRKLWLCYSANYSSGWNGIDLKINPPGGRYGLSLHEVRLTGPGKPQSQSAE